MTEFDVFFNGTTVYIGCKKYILGEILETILDKRYRELDKLYAECKCCKKAYKTHYARYMKKKMSQSEFQKWADYALELRDKAEKGELEFEEYQGLIRK